MAKNAERYLLDFSFAFVSRYLSILEAFAAKRLVFAVYDDPVKEDYLKMTPFAKWMVIEHNPEELAKRVVYFLDHPRQEEEMVRSAYEWAMEQTWDKMVKTYLALWAKSSRVE